MQFPQRLDDADCYFATVGDQDLIDSFAVHGGQL
jgi:hypothetical protein